MNRSRVIYIERLKCWEPKFSLISTTDQQSRTWRTTTKKLRGFTDAQQNSWSYLYIDLQPLNLLVRDSQTASKHYPHSFTQTVKHTLHLPNPHDSH